MSLSGLKSQLGRLPTQPDLYTSYSHTSPKLLKAAAAAVEEEEVTADPDTAVMSEFSSPRRSLSERLGSRRDLSRTPDSDDDSSLGDASNASASVGIKALRRRSRSPLHAAKRGVGIVGKLSRSVRGLKATKRAGDRAAAKTLGTGFGLDDLDGDEQLMVSELSRAADPVPVPVKAPSSAEEEVSNASSSVDVPKGESEAVDAGVGLGEVIEEKDYEVDIETKEDVIDVVVTEKKASAPVEKEVPLPQDAAPEASGTVSALRTPEEVPKPVLEEADPIEMGGSSLSSETPPPPYWLCSSSWTLTPAASSCCSSSSTLPAPPCQTSCCRLPYRRPRSR